MNSNKVSTAQHDNSRSVRTPLFVIFGILTVLWVVQIVNALDGYRLSIDGAIRPRTVDALPYILTAPFLHWSWAHIEANSLPLLILGFIACYRSVRRFIAVSVIVVLTSGLFFWLTGPTGGFGAGASGVIFGYLGYDIVRGFFNHKMVEVLVGFLVGIIYFPVFSLLLPAPHLAYQDHIGGLIGGVACGWLFRAKSNPAAVSSGAAVDRLPKVSAASSEISEAPSPSPSHTPTTPPLHDRVEAELAALRRELNGET